MWLTKHVPTGRTPQLHKQKQKHGTMKAFQDHYPDNLSHCCGCGSNNDHGHRIKTFWEGDEPVTRFTPEPTARGEVVAIQMPENFGTTVLTTVGLPCGA